MILPTCRGASRALLVSAALAFAAACGPASPEPASPAPSASTSTPATPSGDPAPSASVTATAAPDTSAAPSASAAAAPPKPGVPADSSYPAGVNALSEAEQKELATKCKKLNDAIAAAAKKAGGKARPIDVIESVLQSPPKLAGTDVPRCSDLMRRDTIAYLARTRESEAKLNLKRIVVGLVTALEREPPAFCASAPPVPPSLDTVKDKPYQSSMADWKADGWACVRFDIAGGMQVFQYELRTDAKAKTFEAIARGYPVQGAAAAELYIAGKVQNGAIDPSMPVMRR
jgi:hypothetical protein